MPSSRYTPRSGDASRTCRTRSVSVEEQPSRSVPARFAYSLFLSLTTRHCPRCLPARLPWCAPKFGRPLPVRARLGQEFKVQSSTAEGRALSPGPRRGASIRSHHLTRICCKLTFVSSFAASQCGLHLYFLTSFDILMPSPSPSSVSTVPGLSLSIFAPPSVLVYTPGSLLQGLDLSLHPTVAERTVVLSGSILIVRSL